MKTMIISFLTLSFLAYYASAVIPKLLVVDKEGILERMNNDRRQVAKERRITNMHKLVWDESLAMKAKNNDGSGHRVSFRIAHIDGNEHKSKYVRQRYANDGNIDDLMSDFESFHLDGMEQLIPKQTRVGCAPFARQDRNTRVINTFIQCYLGPEGQATSWKTTRGEPGSVCSEGYHNEDGLCALPVKRSAEKQMMESSTGDVTTVADVSSVSNGSQISLITVLVLFMIIFVGKLF